MQWVTNQNWPPSSASSGKCTYISRFQNKYCGQDFKCCSASYSVLDEEFFYIPKPEKSWPFCSSQDFDVREQKSKRKEGRSWYSIPAYCSLLPTTVWLENLSTPSQKNLSSNNQFLNSYESFISCSTHNLKEMRQFFRQFGEKQALFTWLLRAPTLLFLPGNYKLEECRGGEKSSNLWKHSTP